MFLTYFDPPILFQQLKGPDQIIYDEDHNHNDCVVTFSNIIIKTKLLDEPFSMFSYIARWLIIQLNDYIETYIIKVNRILLKWAIVGYLIINYMKYRIVVVYNIYMTDFITFDTLFDTAWVQ